MFRKISISQKLFIYYLTLSFATIVLVSFYSYFTSKKAILERTFEQLTSVRVEKTNNIERFFKDRERDVLLLSKSQFISNLFLNKNDSSLNSDFEKYISVYLNSNNYYNKILLLNNDGEILFQQNSSLSLREKRSNLNAEKTILDNLIQKINLQNKICIQDYELDSAKNPRIFIGGKTQNNGILIFEISINSINSIMYNTNIHNGLGKSGEAYLVGEDFLMRTCSRFQENSIFKTQVKTQASLNAISGKTGIEIVNDYRGISVLSSFSKINILDLKWMIFAEIDNREAMIPIYRLRNSILILSIIIAILVFGIVYIISKKLTQPIVLLKQATAKISSGEYNVKLEIDSTDEFANLIDAFNNMSETLAKQSKQIEIDRLKKLSSLIDGQELERMRLSRDLHDGLAQSILAVKMKLEQTKGADLQKTQHFIAEIQEMIKNIITEIRNISSNLMPPVLESFGIDQALRKLCNDTSSTSAIEVEYLSENLPLDLNSKTQIYLYRISQEAINNIVKHSKATKSLIKISCNENTILLNIADNGIGFNFDESKNKGKGLGNIKERVELLGGTLRFISDEKKGSEFKIEIPV